MSKILEVPRLGKRPHKAEDVSGCLDAEGVGFNVIGSANWHDEYPYIPDVRFRIAYTGNSIILNYRVEELSVRAVEGADNGKVWEDSCVEFFFSKNASSEYYNVECNCIGSVLIACGPDRNNRKHLSSDKLLTVERFSTLGRNTFQEKSAPHQWEISLIIPIKLFGIDSLRGKELYANFYKCGDLLEAPHFLSWNPIKTPSPDFHRPEFFGKLIFKS